MTLLPHDIQQAVTSVVRDKGQSGHVAIKLLAALEAVSIGEPSRNTDDEMHRRLNVLFASLDIPVDHG